MEMCARRCTHTFNTHQEILDEFNVHGGWFQFVGRQFAACVSLVTTVAPFPR